MTRLKKFIALSWAERRLLLQVALLIAALRVGLSILPLRDVRRAVDWGIQVFPVLLPARRPSPAEIAWAVSRVSGSIPGATCLTQALAVQAQLGRLGYPVRLCIAIGKSEDQGLGGHAWVESQGNVVIGGGLPAHYVPLAALERTGRSAR